MKSDSKKLKRLLQAQAVLEHRALLEVSVLDAKLTSIEERLQAAQTSVSKPDISLLFLDLYVRHLHNLTTECAIVQGDLENARAKLQSEKTKLQRIHEKVRESQRVDERTNAELDILERLSQAS